MEQIGTVHPTQTMAMLHPMGGSVVPHQDGKVTNLTSDQTKLIMKMPRQNSKAPKVTKKEKKGMSKIQEKKKMAHVKCFNMRHNVSMCFNKVDDQATLPKNKTRRSKRKYYGCNEKGHEIGSCPNKKSEGLVSSTKRLIFKVASKTQEEKANKNKSRLYYTYREKGHLSMDCPMGNTPKLNLSIDSNMLRRPKNDTCARKEIGSPCASTKAIWMPKSLVTNYDGPNIVWVPNYA
jgi:hypothetical protein